MNNQALRAFPVILEFAQHSIFGILQSIVCKRNNSFELIKKATTRLLLLLRRLGSNADALVSMLTSRLCRDRQHQRYDCWNVFL